MNFKAFAAAATTVATSVLTPLAASANNYVPQEGSFAAHVRLAKMLEKSGVDFILNPSKCDERDALGWYNGRGRELVVCQENKIPGSSREVAWTDEDLDTLRHEAQHAIQDCMVGGNHDHRLGSVYDRPVALAKRHLSPRTINWIINTGYRDASDHVKVLELEAFAVASMNRPLMQTRDIANFCF